MNVSPFKDLVTLGKYKHIWLILGFSDIRQRYARSKFGQLWVALNTLINIIMIGLVWSVLWKLPVREFLQYIAFSSVFWAYITATIQDSATTFLVYRGYILSERHLMASFVAACLYRNTLTMVYNFPVALVTLMLGFA